MFRVENATTYLVLDDKYVSIETGLPKSKWKLEEVLGGGAIILGGGALSGRQAKVSRHFMKTEEDERELYFQWFTKPQYEDIWFRKTTTSFDGIVECRLGLDGGEVFTARNFNYSKEIGFNIFMGCPYFESTSVTTVNITSTGTTQVTDTITISGGNIYPNFYVATTESFSLLEVISGESYGFTLNYSFNAGDVIRVYTSEAFLRATVNGLDVSDYFSADSTPFDLQSGTNTVYSRSANCTIELRYNERRL